MKFVKLKRAEILFKHICQIVVIGLIAFAVVSCSSVPSSVVFEPRAMAKKLAMPDCKVSVPLSRSEVIEDAKRLGNPYPERNQDWIIISESLMAGDQLRAIDCLSSKSTYFYALIRDDSIVLKFYSSMFD